MKNLESYLASNLIKHAVISPFLIEINGMPHQLVSPNEEGKIFDEEFTLIIEEKHAEWFVFSFGGKYYHTDSENKPQLTPLKYIGEAEQELPTENYLGVRGNYELLNGSRLYKDWCAKAKFLGIKSLGICEKNTLAGTLKFQLECKKNGIKPVLGATYTVWDDVSDYRYDIKCYAKNESGWSNLLLINKEVNVTNTRFIYEKDFLNLTDGLIIVADPKSIDFERVKKADYYQLDTAEFKDTSRDRWYLENLKKFFCSGMEPVSIRDSFYLDKEDSHIKQVLNQIGGFQEYVSENQYFKPSQDYFFELSELFGDMDERLYEAFEVAVGNEGKIAEECTFEIEVGKRHLPAYKMNEHEKKRFKTNEDLFFHAIEEGFSKKCPKGKEDEYLERLSYEIEIIKMVNGENGSTGIDYFLILWDVVNYCNKNNILLGHGRGSSGGCTVAWYLDIVKSDPIKNKLLFSRFLNPSRASGSLPDIDIDIDPDRKEEVKMYVRDKYGYDQFCYIGTYSTFQLKQSVTDLSKIYGASVGEIKITSPKIDEKDFSGLFKDACKKPILENFVKKYSNGISDIPLILGLPRAKSVHACATIIFPSEKTIYEYIPVRKVFLENNESVLVSEWEGADLEYWGALKEDFLVINQLSKYADILKLLELNKNEPVDIYNLSENNPKVYDYFSKGYTSDIFQFGTKEFKQYLKNLKPDNIDELVNAVALYRPGAIKVNSHLEYVNRKFGKSEITYKFGTESVTKDTKGLLIMQEQVIQLCQTLGGLSEAEGDNVRKAIGKKSQDLMDKYKIQFIEGALKNGCPQKDAEDIWHDIEVHGEYSFNLSHSLNYTKISHVGMYFKVFYPLYFWTAAFGRDSNGENTSEYISEIGKTGDIKVLPCDINISETSTKTDFKTNTIYWALSAIKNIGEIATDQIMEDRNANGQYFSLEEFIDRNCFKGSKVNKRTIENLIMSGAFDEIESISEPRQRLRLISQYRESQKIKVSEGDILEDENIQYNWWWTLQQKRLSGIAFFDYPTLASRYFSASKKFPYMDYVEFMEETSARKGCTIAGYVSKCELKEMAKGAYARITLENNYDFIEVMVWPEQFDMYEDMLAECEGNIMMINGIINSYRGSTSLQTCESTKIEILV